MAPNGGHFIFRRESSGFRTLLTAGVLPAALRAPSASKIAPGDFVDPRSGAAASVLARFASENPSLRARQIGRTADLDARSAPEGRDAGSISSTAHPSPKSATNSAPRSSNPHGP
jgi:hypothetical protein